MLNDSILPDMPSAEFDAIYNLVSRAVRAARNHNPATSFDEIAQSSRLSEFLTRINRSLS